MKNLFYIALFTFIFLTTSYAEDQNKHEEHTEEQKLSSGVEALSHELRDLLSREMQAIQDGMMSIIPAYISGNWEEIETTAGKIKNFL